MQQADSDKLEQVVGKKDVTVVKVGNQIQASQFKSFLSKLAEILSDAILDPYVVFALQAQQKDLLQEIRTALAEFPNPDRVDVVHQGKDLAAKLSFIEAKLKVAPPRPSPLDELRQVVEATKDLRTEKGNLSARKVADVFGISVNQLGRNRQTLSKTPDADSLQDELAYFERVARLRAGVKQEGFLKWLRMSNGHLDKKKPLDLLAQGERQVVADLVDDMLTGAPA